jgi:pimeloyl-ACP methyl ester carboxylesterase
MVTFTATDGVRLGADIHAGEREPPVVLLHGGGQTRHAWGATVRLLADSGWTTVAVDLRGHGDSEWSLAGDYRLETFADDVRTVVGAMTNPPVLVGASLGGFAALLALSQPPIAMASGLVLVDVAHRFELEGGHRIADFMRAHRDGFEHPRDAAAAVARYLPHRPSPADLSGIEKNLRLRDGRWYWHWDPDLLGAGRRLFDPQTRVIWRRRFVDGLRAMKLPTLLVRGALSDVISREIAGEFARLVPHAQVVEVDGAAHMVAGDQNDCFTEAIVDFLEALPLTAPAPKTA